MRKVSPRENLKDIPPHLRELKFLKESLAKLIEKRDRLIQELRVLESLK